MEYNEYEDFERPIMGGFDPEEEACYAELDRLRQIIKEDPEYKNLICNDFSFLPATCRDWTEEETEKVGDLHRALSRDLREAESLERIARNRSERCKRALAVMHEHSEEHSRFKERKSKIQEMKSKRRAMTSLEDFSAYCDDAFREVKALEEKSRKASDEAYSFWKDREPEALQPEEFKQALALNQKCNDLDKEIERFCNAAIERMEDELYHNFMKVCVASQSSVAYDTYNRAWKIKQDFVDATRDHWDRPLDWEIC